VRSSYTFHPLSAADLPRVRQWLAAPHVAEWWGDPDEQFESVRGDLNHPSMNQFIGEPDLISQGHGSGFIRTFADDLIGTGTARVVSDPGPLNARAIRAYEKAGFRRRGRPQMPDGPAFLMVRDA